MHTCMHTIWQKKYSYVERSCCKKWDLKRDLKVDQVDTSSVWDPHTQKNINRAEAVQWWAAHFIFSRYRNICSVSSMLEALDWPTVERRRQICRLSMLYKILSILVHCPSLKSKFAPLPLTSDKVMTGSSVDFFCQGPPPHKSSQFPLN